MKAHGLAPTVSPGALVLAAAIPVLFLHVHYQPGFGIGVGSTTANAYLSDFAVLAVVVVAVWSGVRDGFGPLARGRWVWLAAGLFLAWMFVEVAYGRSHSAGYAWHTHGVTAAKFAEYALLAPAVPLLIRRARDLVLPLWSLAVWSALATAVGLAQFLGAAIFLAGTVGRRQASFLSSADFAALSAAALLVGIVAVAVPRLRLGRALTAVATASGALGMILAGALASVLGLATALVLLVVVLVLRRELDTRRIAAIGATAVVVLVGTVAIRGSDLDAFVRFLGASPGKQAANPAKIQSYPQRSLLAWIGFEIWKDHPLLGVGWEGSAEPANFLRYIPAARLRFSGVSPSSFPSAAPNHRYGVQNVWIQALADLGAIGLVLWAAVFAAAAWIAGRTAVRVGAATAFIGLVWTGLLVWLWTAQGYVAGIPLDALTWLAFGLAATLPGEE
jgi:O-antigen ligase